MTRAQAGPLRAEVSTARLVQRRVKYAVYRAMQAVVRPALRAAYGFEVTGALHMPRRGPVLVVANHLHNFDPVVLGAALPRPILYMAKEELFAHPVFSWLIRGFGAYAVRRGTPDRAALRQTRVLLAQGLVVGLFPEGTRSLSGQLGAAQPGVALVALQAGAPVLPVGISGTESLPFDAKAAGRAGAGRAGSRTRPRVAIGQPFTVGPLARHDKAALAAAGDRIMREIAALLPPEYRGDYA